jgi:hypothetical protein
MRPAAIPRAAAKEAASTHSASVCREPSVNRLLWNVIVPLVTSVAAGAASGWFAARLQSRQESRARRQKTAIWRSLGELGSNGIISADDLFKGLQNRFRNRDEFDAVMLELTRDGLVSYEQAFRSYSLNGSEAHNPYIW